MRPSIPSSPDGSGLSRRKFLWLTSASLAGLALGCAVDPVTGKRQVVLVSEQQEVQIDRQHAPHQFSNDFGKTQDRRLASYVAGVGKNLVPLTHRTQMPYNFHVVNATYVNAYAFPGGSIAATRGILLKLENEGELAGLIGHELCHVNALHTAEQMPKGQLTNLVLAGAQMAIGQAYSEGAAQAFGQISQIGASALLASYSRSNEREADRLGNQYMVQAGYNTGGFVGLMEMLQNLSNGTPGYAQILFSTHPMSQERYQTAVDAAMNQYAETRGRSEFRDRYMDNIAGLRSIQGAIENIQQGDEAMAKKQYDQAADRYRRALGEAPEDYAGLTQMAKCQYVQEKYGEARRYAEAAQQAYPGEAQAHQISGMARMQLRDYDGALGEFQAYERILPGNPAMTFLQGLAYENMGRRENAAKAYQAFLQAVQQGPQAQHAYKRLVEWGYVQG
jgi:predicted Zn-dependent protease